MVRVDIETVITAPIERCFDLARSIDLHVQSTGGSGESAIAGTAHGLIGLGERVRWRGRHFGLMLEHESLITEYVRPNFFVDEMTSGAFKTFRHKHAFRSDGTGTVMADKLEFSAPVPVLGWLAERLFLRCYLRGFLERRNGEIKDVAESERWREFL